ncbi:hypothetical protein GCM10011335_31710 [Aureimonas glaciei]|uniref:Uncharacterized protein n=1 Tax=Aureimonas glaciei TaxID=1776957 RepID=A0A916Y1F5_9HYPH|nr:hypothetical protein GCM10011335_31710 [Aureimonas glaciei]
MVVLACDHLADRKVEPIPRDLHLRSWISLEDFSRPTENDALACNNANACRLVKPEGLEEIEDLLLRHKARAPSFQPRARALEHLDPMTSPGQQGRSEQASH